MRNIISRILLLLTAISCSILSASVIFGQGPISSFNSISREEVELLVEDVAKINPNSLKRFVEDPELKKQQLENLKELLSFAKQAQKDGMVGKPANRQELENIRSEVVAVNYDKEINKDKGPMPPLGGITEAQIKQFWSNSEHETRFQKFLDSKIELLKQDNPQMKDREFSEEERTQSRDYFAKIEIYEKEFDDKVASGQLPLQFKKKVDLQVKLQQAQFLARLYSDVIAGLIHVSDEDVAKYLAEHKEFDTSAKKAKAEDILKRAKAGEDFAALANEFSDDPGIQVLNGKQQGGIYVDVPTGKMVAPFEEAALALKPGQIAPNLVETDFGYHVIKLEKKSVGKDSAGQQVQTYDVRHILISTTYKYPDGRDVPVKAYVRTKLEEDKEKPLLDKIIADNNVQVPDDFTVPNIIDAPVPKTIKKRSYRKKRPVRKRALKKSIRT